MRGALTRACPFENPEKVNSFPDLDLGFGASLPLEACKRYVLDEGGHRNDRNLTYRRFVRAWYRWNR